MGYLRRIAAPARRRIGRAVHDAGAATRSDISALQEELHRLGREVDSSRAALDAVNHLRSSHTEVLNRLAHMDNLLAIDCFSRFIAHATLQHEPLVSIVLPTYNRPDLLRRAAASVIAQRYRNWELIVIDDGSDHHATPVTASIGDERIRCLRVEHRGAGAARNAGLATVRGEIVAYLDDDNVMDPQWIYSVVWAFEQRPDVEVLYGAFVIDDVRRVTGVASGALPRTLLNAWDRTALERYNLTDMGAMAHRSGLPEARFDESLQQMGDWDLLLKLTANRDPLVLPAVACYYTTDAPGRLSLGATYDLDRDTVMKKATASMS